MTTNREPQTARARRRIAKGAAAVAVIALLSACSSSGGGQADDDAATITWWSWLSNAPELAAEYEAQNPNVQVEFAQVPAGEQAYTKYGAALQAGSGAADVLQIEYQVLPQFASDGHLIDLSDRLGGVMDQFSEFAQGMVTYDDKLWGAPVDLDPMMLLYKPEILEANSIDVPTTWDEFADAAEELHKADSSKYLTFFAPNNGGRNMGMLWQGGANPIQDLGDGSWKVDFTSSEARTVMNFWGDLIDSGAVNVESDFTPAWGNSISTGVYAMDVGAIWSPTYEIGPYLAPDQHTWQAAVMPQWDAANPQQSMWGGLTFSVTDQADNPEAAADFVAWLSTNAAAIESNGTAGGLYSASKTFPDTAAYGAEVPVLAKQKMNELAGTIIPELEKSDFRWSPWTQFAYGQMQEQFQLAADGSISFDEALENVQAKVVEAIEQDGYTVE